MTKSEKNEIKDLVRRPLLLDMDSGVYWDFDFDNGEFRVGTACNTGLLVDFKMKWKDGCSACEQLEELLDKAEEYYHEQGNV